MLFIRNNTLRMIWQCGLALAMPLCVMGCRGEEEWQIRQAVKRIIAGDHDRRQAADFVVARGRRAMPEIEQQIHAAGAGARTRLVEVLRRIGDRDALHLIRVVQRWDGDQAVQAACRRAIAALTSDSRPSP